MRKYHFSGKYRGYFPFRAEEANFFTLISILHPDRHLIFGVEFTHLRIDNVEVDLFIQYVYVILFELLNVEAHRYKYMLY